MNFFPQRRVEGETLEKGDLDILGTTLPSSRNAFLFLLTPQCGISRSAGEEVSMHGDSGTKNEVKEALASIPVLE